MKTKLRPMFEVIHGCQGCEDYTEIPDDAGGSIFLCNPAEDEITGPVEIGKELPPDGEFPDCCPLEDGDPEGDAKK